MCTHKSEYTHPPGRLPPQYMNFIPPTHTWQLQWMYCLLHWLYNVYTCYKCDYTHPPLASKKRFHFHPLSTVLDCVLITLHTPNKFSPTTIPVIDFHPPSTHPHTLSYFGVFTAARLYNVYTCYKCDYTHPPLASKKRFHLYQIPTVLDFENHPPHTK